MRFSLPIVVTGSALVLGLSLAAAAQDDKSAAPAKSPIEKPVTEHRDPKIISYIIGGDIGATIKRSEIQLNLDAFVEGLKQALNGDELKYTDESRSQILRAYSKDKQLPKDLVENIVSYVMGGDTGVNLRRSGLEFELNSFIEGLKSAFSGRELKYSQEYQQRILNAFTLERQLIDRKRSLMTAHAVKSDEDWNSIAAKNKKSGEEFLAANLRNQGVKATASGLQYQIIKQGDGAIPKSTDRVKAAYKGTVIDGAVFVDSTILKPTEFRVCDEIAGVAEALQLMPVGSKWRLAIPSNLAYGEFGRRPPIGPNATLILEIELAEIAKPSPQPSKLVTNLTQPILVTLPKQQGEKAKVSAVDSQSGQTVGEAKDIGPQRDSKK